MNETATFEEGLTALRTSAGFASLQDVGWIAVTGADRVRWLNGMVTNSVQALRPGEGAYTFLLNAQGRIQGDATIWCSSDTLLLLETDRTQVAPMVELLDRFIIMDEVELEDVSAAWHGLRLAGPAAAGMLQALGLPVMQGGLRKQSDVAWQGHAVSVIAAYSPLVPHYEIWSRDTDAIEAAKKALAEAGAKSVTPESFELLRIVEGTPRFAVDIRDRDLPQETAQTRALHFSKGCYLGQEIVERIRSRGQVHRTFVQFSLSGDVPPVGAELLVDDKPVGVLTSIGAMPVGGEHVALGYVRREVIDRGTAIHFEGGTATVRPSALPAAAEAATANAASNA